MAYLCVQCDERFESEDERPRCPKCMRVHGIHTLDDEGKPKDADEQNAARVIGYGPSLAIVVLVVVAVAVYSLRGEEPEAAVDGEGGAGAVASDALSTLLEADDAIGAFASAAAGGQPEGLPRAEAIVKAVRARASAMAFVPWSRVDPRPRAPLVAAAAQAKLAKDGGRAKLYPLEVAAVAVASMRSVGVDAKVAEVHWFEGDRSPPDPSGRLGYFGVSVTSGGATQVLDPYGGRAAKVAAADHTVLTDEQAVAAAIALRAMQNASPTGDLKRALRDSERALKLLPRSPSVRGVHGLALLVTGAGEQGMAEFEAAHQLRDDAPRNLNLAFAQMAKGDIPGASTRLARALELAPEYAAAHMNLARLHLAQANRDQAREALEEAQRLDPDLPALLLVWATYHMSAGEWPEAMVRATSALELQPDNPEAHIAVARIHRELGNYDEMRRHARTLLELVSESQRSRTRDLLTAMLGSTALEEPDDEEEEVDDTTEVTADAGLAAPADQFDLRAGSKLLGGGKGKGGLQLGGDKPTLLGGSGDDLKLELDP